VIIVGVILGLSSNLIIFTAAAWCRGLSDARNNRSPEIHPLAFSFVVLFGLLLNLLHH